MVLNRISEKQRSIIIDGFLVAAALYLFLMMMQLFIIPIQVQFGRSGLLIFSLGILTASIIFLDRSFHVGYGVEQARYGLAGGVLGWIFISSIDALVGLFTTSAQSFLWLLFLGLFSAVLWRRILPLGVKFYLGTIVLCWLGRFIISAESQYSHIWDMADNLRMMTGWIADVGVVPSPGWILVKATNRIQRIFAAMLLWFNLVIVCNVLFHMLL